MDITKFGLIPSQKCAHESGAKFGRWTLLGFGRKPNSEVTVTVAQCACGSPPRIVRLGNIVQGLSTNCGCVRREGLTKHGMAARSSTRRELYRVWRNMMDRCYRETHRAFPNYGARGIFVYERWHDVANFVADMEPTYAPGLTIERRKNDKEYSADNCHWVTPTTQTRNRRTTLFLEYGGQTKSLGEWADLLGMDYRLIYQRLKYGWTVEQAFTEKKGKYKERGA